MKIGIGLYPDERADRLLQTAQLADRLGYSTLWIPDSQLLWREVYAVLGAVAATTQRIKLATAVTNVVTRHPTVTASAFRTLDELSGGRAIIGISVGDSALATLGLKPVAVGAFGKALVALRELVSSRSIQTTEGKEARLGYGGWRPIPIYVAATGPRMLKLAGQLADGVILMNGVAPELIRAAIDLVHDGAREAKRDLSAVKLLVWAGCHSSADEPKRSLEAVKYNVARAILRNMPGPIDERTRVTAEKVRARYDYTQHGDARAAFAALVPDELVPRFAFAGTPQAIADQIAALKTLGVDEVALAVPSTMAFSTRDAVLELLAPGRS